MHADHSRGHHVLAIWLRGWPSGHHFCADHYSGVQPDHFVDDVIVVRDCHQYRGQRGRHLFFDQPKSGRGVWRCDRVGVFFGASHFSRHVCDWIFGSPGGLRASGNVQSCRCNDLQYVCIHLCVYRSWLDDSTPVFHSGDFGGFAGVVLFGCDSGF